MMNAKEASKVAHEAKVSRLLHQVDEAGPKALELYMAVEHLVPEACWRGEFSFSIPVPTGINTVESVAVYNLLQALGYTIFRPTHGGVEYLLVRWED